MRGPLDPVTKTGVVVIAAGPALSGCGWRLREYSPAELTSTWWGAGSLCLVPGVQVLARLLVRRTTLKSKNGKIGKLNKKEGRDQYINLGKSLSALWTEFRLLPRWI